MLCTPLIILRRLIVLGAICALAACESMRGGVTPVPPAATPAPAPVTTAPTPAEPAVPAEKPPVPAVKPAVTPPAPTPAQSTLRKSSFDAITAWRDDNLLPVWPAFLAGCRALRTQAAWQSVCEIAAALPDPSQETIRRFFETRFTPWQAVNADGSDSGMITGYYEPLLRGSRKRTNTYRYPVYGTPDDMLVVDLSELYPELKNMRLRGRIDGRRVVPYYNRAQIENGTASVTGKEIVWVADAIDLFFLQIQGSGRVRFDNG